MLKYCSYIDTVIRDRNRSWLQPRHPMRSWSEAVEVTAIATWMSRRCDTVALHLTYIDLFKYSLVYLNGSRHYSRSPYAKAL